MNQKIRRTRFFLKAVFFLSLLCYTSIASALSEPEGKLKGYLYEASRDAILTGAKKEGSLRAQLSLDMDTIKVLQEAFRKHYPFLDCHFEEVTGTDAAARFLLELQSGRKVDWDVYYLSPENYNHLQPHVEKVDLLSMARKKILNIPTAMIDPHNRNALSMTTSTAVVVYNSKLLAPDKVPATWEDFLKPEWKGRKFVLDVMPRYLAGMVPAMGMEWVLDYARKLAAQNPVWASGQTRMLTAMAAGEYALALGTNYHSLMRSKRKGMPQLEPLFIEPVSIRMGEVLAVGMGARHPYAAMLLLEFIAGPEGQRLIDESDPGKASVFVPTSMVNREIAGRRISVLDWNHFEKQEGYISEIVKALGFPKAKTK